MEKRRKELMFLGVGVAILALAMFVTFRPRAKPASAQEPAGTEAVQTSSGAALGAETALAGVHEVPAKPDGDATFEAKIGKPGRDPFVPVMVAGVPLVQTGTLKPVRTAMRNPFAQAGTLPPAVITPISLTTFSGPSGMIGGGPGLRQQAPVQDSRLRVTGIVYGDPTVAIVRKGAAHWVVQPGDQAGGYVVESISGRRVVLAAGGERKSLFLEGRF